MWRVVAKSLVGTLVVIILGLALGSLVEDWPPPTPAWPGTPGVAVSVAPETPETPERWSDDVLGDLDPAVCGRLSIQTRFVGRRTRPVPVDTSMDRDAPADLTADEEHVNDDRSVPWVFVEVQGPALARLNLGRPRDAVWLQLDGYRYRPHVVGLMVGQRLGIWSADQQTTHGIHVLGRRFSSRATLTYSPYTPQQFETAAYDGAARGVEARCDHHPWEQAWVHVLDHPFFTTTGEDGRGELPWLPAGRYRVLPWHPRFAVQPQLIHVRVGETTTVRLRVRDDDAGR